MVLHLSHSFCLYRCLELGGGRDLRRPHRVGLRPLLDLSKEPPKCREEVSRINAVVAITKKLKDAAWKDQQSPASRVTPPAAHYRQSRSHVTINNPNLPIVVIKAVEIHPD